MPNKVNIYILSKDGCPACSKMKKIIKKLDSSFLNDNHINKIHIYNVNHDMSYIPKSLDELVNYLPLVVISTKSNWKKGNVNKMIFFNGKLYNNSIKSYSKYSFNEKGFKKWILKYNKNF